MKWISVKDRLPKELEWVLMGKKNFVEQGIYDQGQFYQPDIRMVRTGITHWMPLPEPPSSLPKITIGSNDNVNSYKPRSSSGRKQRK